MAAHSAELRVVPNPFPSGKVYADCVIDGTRVTCFLDTGSAMSLVAPQGKFKRYPDLGSFQFKSASGKPQRADTIQTRTFELDGHTVRNARVGRLRDDSVEDTLGMDILGRQPFALEFRNRPAMRVSPKPPEKTSNDLSVGRHGLMSVPVTWGEAPALAVWDTGATITAVDLRFARTHPENFKRVRRHVDGIDGTGQKISVESWRAKKLQVGSRSFRNVLVVALDLGLLNGETSGRADAVLGFNIIRKADWYFDPARRRWSVR